MLGALIITCLEQSPTISYYRITHRAKAKSVQIVLCNFFPLGTIEKHTTAVNLKYKNARCVWSVPVVHCCNGSLFSHQLSQRISQTINKCDPSRKVAYFSGRTKASFHFCTCCLCIWRIQWRFCIVILYLPVINSFSILTKAKAIIVPVVRSDRRIKLPSKYRKSCSGAVARADKNYRRWCASVLYGNQCLCDCGSNASGGVMIVHQGMKIDFFLSTSPKHTLAQETFAILLDVGIQLSAIFTSSSWNKASKILRKNLTAFYCFAFFLIPLMSTA